MVITTGRRLHLVALGLLVTAWVVWGHAMLVIPVFHWEMPGTSAREWQAAIDVALVVPYWVVSLLVLAYVPLAVLVRVPASVTAVASLALAALLVSLRSEATLLLSPDLAPPLTVATLLAGASTTAACAAVVHRDHRLGMSAGVRLPVPLLARCAAALVLIGWVTIIVVWQLAPQVHLAPEDDVEPGEAFGINVLAIWPYAMATTWMVPAGVAGVLGRLFPGLIVLNALILLGATTWVRLGFRLDELVPMLGPALQWGTRLAAVALSLLATIYVRDELAWLRAREAAQAERNA